MHPSGKNYEKNLLLPADRRSFIRIQKAERVSASLTFILLARPLNNISFKELFFIMRRHPFPKHLSALLPETKIDDYDQSPDDSVLRFYIKHLNSDYPDLKFTNRVNGAVDSHPPIPFFRANGIPDSFEIDLKRIHPFYVNEAGGLGQWIAIAYRKNEKAVFGYWL